MLNMYRQCDVLWMRCTNKKTKQSVRKHLRSKLHGERVEWYFCCVHIRPGWTKMTMRANERAPFGERHQGAKLVLCCVSVPEWIVKRCWCGNYGIIKCITAKAQANEAAHSRRRSASVVSFRICMRSAFCERNAVINMHVRLHQFHTHHKRAYGAPTIHTYRSLCASERRT